MSILNAITSGAGGVALSGDTSGNLTIQSAGSNVATFNTGSIVGIGASPSSEWASSQYLQVTSPSSYSVASLATTRTVADGNRIGSFTFEMPNNTATYRTRAVVESIMTGSTAGAYGAYLTLSTANDGTQNPTERMRITSLGFTKMANSGAFLSSTGTYHEMKTDNNNVIAYFSNSGASTPYGLDLYFSAAAPNNASQWFHLCEDTGGVRFVAMANGGLKNYSANNVNLSDQSVKKDINLAGNYLDKICAIPVKTFLYIDQTDTDLNLGVIAQDVQAVAPELVTETDWGNKDNPNVKLSVYESDLVFALMKSIQELNAKVEAQAAEIAALKGAK